MDVVIRSAANLFLGLFIFLVIVLIFVFGTGFTNPKTAEASEKYGQKELLEKGMSIVQIIGSPEIRISTTESDKGYKYDVHLTVTAGFAGISDESITIWPVLLYKNARNRDEKLSEITLNSKEQKTVELDYEIISSEPPILLRQNETNFSGKMVDNQLLFLKNFSFTVNMEQYEIPLIDFPLEPKFGRCSAVVSVQCPSENMFAKLSLGDEDKPCLEQAKREDCRKDLVMCDARVDLELERLAPGTSKCRSKIPTLSIEVGEIKESQFKWKVGEDLFISFWKKPDDKKLTDCWKGLATAQEKDKCLELFVGGYSITILPESYGK